MCNDKSIRTDASLSTIYDHSTLLEIASKVSELKGVPSVYNPMDTRKSPMKDKQRKLTNRHCESNGIFTQCFVKGTGHIFFIELKTISSRCPYKSNKRLWLKF